MWLLAYMDSGNGRKVAKGPDLFQEWGFVLHLAPDNFCHLLLVSSTSRCSAPHALRECHECLPRALQKLGSVAQLAEWPGEGAGRCCCCKSWVTHALQLAPDGVEWLAGRDIHQRGHWWGAEAVKVVLTSQGSAWWEGKGRSAAVGDDLCCNSVGVVGFNACQEHFDLWMESFGVNLCLLSSLFSP